MEYYSYTDNKILIAHFPGDTKIDNKELLNEFSQRTISVPDNIDIVSVMTTDQMENYPLYKQLNNNNISYINPVDDRVLSWQAKDKLQYVLEGLKKSTKDYVLCLDGNDVAILTDLTDIVEIFKTYDKKLIYNATIWLYPQVIIETIPNRGRYGRFKYLNAGCCIGEREYMIKFYEAALDLLSKDVNPVNSEQYYIRKAFNARQKDVFFDYQCKIFQCWHKPEYSIKGNKCTIY